MRFRGWFIRSGLGREGQGWGGKGVGGLEVRGAGKHSRRLSLMPNKSGAF